MNKAIVRNFDSGFEMEINADECKSYQIGDIIYLENQEPDEDWELVCLGNNSCSCDSCCDAR